jgi:hypothetical protein
MAKQKIMHSWSQNIERTQEQGFQTMKKDGKLKDALENPIFLYMTASILYCLWKSLDIVPLSRVSP